MTERFPESTALGLDPGTRRSDRGRTLIGGSPLRLLRVTDHGARIVDAFGSGEPVGPDPGRQRLARRLTDAGLAHPVPTETPDVTVAVVIPARDHAAEVGALLDDLVADRGDADRGPVSDLVIDVVVVDDGSLDPATLRRAVAGRAAVIRHQQSRGPGAARNTGWRSTSADLVAFVDADVSVPSDWLRPLVDHFGDPEVGAVAPRVRSSGGSSLLDRYESVRSPLDLGPTPARVVPGGRVSYVPTAAVVFRREVLAAVGGFDEALTAGEDVDLVWRTHEAGHRVRYEPAVEVTHGNRPGWSALARQRAHYGSAAAPLDRRHPGAVAPIRLNAWSLAAWALVAAGGRRGLAAGTAVGFASTAALVPRLRGRVDHPVAEAVNLAGRGNLTAGRWLASATMRAWLPAALPLVVGSTRRRRLLVTAAVVPPLVEWVERRPPLDPVRYTAARILDDAAYCLGVWRGCRRERSWRSTLPRLEGIPGLVGRGRRGC